MRVIAAITLLLLLTPSAQAQANNVRWDPRIELFSILFHLAGAPEYSTNKVPAYAAAVAAYFETMKSHPAVTMTRELGEKNGIRYFHPMTLAVHVSPPPELHERTPLDQPGHALTPRLEKVQLRRYLEHVRAFVRDAEVQAFFDLNRPMFAACESRLRDLVEAHGDEEWFARYTGTAASTTFLVAPSLLNGGAQYGPTYRGRDGVEESYAIIGIYKLDRHGLPLFDIDDADNVVHELAHTLVNRAVQARLGELDAAGPALYARVAEKMRAQSYGTWQTMIFESIVRAIVVRYIDTHRGGEAAMKEIEAQEASGFTLTAELVDLLSEYEKTRDRYPTLESFMPSIVKLLQSRT